MRRLPLLMHLKIKGQDGGFGLWLPLFLLIPLVLLVFIILSPLVFIAVVVLWPSGWGKRALLILRSACEVFCAMRGLEVDVKNHNHNVLITVV